MKLLFTKGHIGKLEIKNRAVMPAMGTNMSDGGRVNRAIVNHYEQRAKGGVGLIIVEVTCVDTPLGLNTPDMLRMDTDECIEGHQKITDAVHKHGAKVMLQLSHTGRGAKPDVIGAQPVGPSAVAMPFSFMMGLSGVSPRALTIDEVKTIEDKYAQAALRAKKAGYDGVQIHACGYYLCQQFLSSQANIRNDEYGGSKENRSRFVTNIISKIKKLCAEDFPVIVKISVLEIGKEAGIKLGEGLYYSYRFQEAGADAIEVLAGAWNETAKMSDTPETGQKKGIALPLCKLLRMARARKSGKVGFIFGRKAIRVPLIGGGRTFEPAIVEKALAKTCDFVFMGRGVLCEPNLVNLMREDKYDLARPCIGCNHCVNEQLQFRHSISCAGCAVLGSGENDYTIEKAKAIKNIVVIGGGPAGCELARIAAMRGHKVSLIEQSDRIGGQIALAIIPPNKQNVEPLIGYYEKQLAFHGVKVILNERATKESIAKMNPDTVIFATGTKPARPNIKGIDSPIMADYKDVLHGKKTGKKVTIIGGGTIGCELAELLAKKRKKVTLVEMTDTLAAKMPKTAQATAIGHLQHLNVTTLMNAAVTAITEKGVELQSGGKNQFVPSDTVILCVGDKPADDLYKASEDSFKEVYNIGDSDTIGDIKTAVAAGYHLGLKI